MRRTMSNRDSEGRPGKYVSDLYDSLDELADAAMAAQKAGITSVSRYRTERAADLAHNGWDGDGRFKGGLETALKAAQTSMGDLNLSAVTMQYDLAGGSVAMDRYLTGLPDSMVSFPLHQTSNAGRIVRLCASVDAYAGVDIEARGFGICALVQALSELGHGVELYLDVFCNKMQGSPRWGGQVRCLVKSASDTLDMSKVMFAYAFDDTMPALGMPCTHQWPKESHGPNRIGESYGSIGNPTQDLPEGTLYIPHAMHGYLLTPENLVKHYLIKLGLAESDGTEGEFTEWTE